MAIIDSTDIGVCCDDCGATANVDMTNAVLHKLAQREWDTHGHEICSECANKKENNHQGGASTRTEPGGDTFHCENCERDFTDKPHAPDDGYWLSDPCWQGLKGERDICECRCHGYHEVRAATCQHCG